MIGPKEFWMLRGEPDNSQWAQGHAKHFVRSQKEKTCTRSFHTTSPGKAILSEHHVLLSWHGKHASHEENLTQVLNPARKPPVWSEIGGHHTCRVCNEHSSSLLLGASKKAINKHNKSFCLKSYFLPT